MRPWHDVPEHAANDRPLSRAQARGMCRSELVRRSGVSKQQLSRLENGMIRIRLDHLKPFAAVLGYTPEQMLLWGKYPGTGAAISNQATCCAKSDPRRALGQSPARCPNSTPAPASAAAASRPAKCARMASTPTHLRPKDGCFPIVSCASNFTPRRAGSWCSIPPATAWRRQSSPASASSSIPATRRRRPTGSMPSAHLRKHRGQALAGVAFVPADAGKNHFRQAEMVRARKSARRNRDRRQGAVLSQIVLRRPTFSSANKPEKWGAGGRAFLANA